MIKFGDELLYVNKPVNGICSDCGAVTESFKHPEKPLYLKYQRTVCDLCIKKEKEAKKELFLKRIKGIKDGHQRIAIRCGMPERFKDSRREDFNTLQLQRIQDILSNLKDTTGAKQFLIYGASGVGKGHFASYIFKAMIYNYENPSDVYKVFSWKSLAGVYEKIKSSFNDAVGAYEEQLLNDGIYYPKLLVFEFGDIEREGVLYKAEQSPYLQNVFFKIVDFRWRTKRPTIYITREFKNSKNILSQLTKHYDEATVGRLLEDSQQIRMVGKNFREKKAGQRSIWEM